MWEVKTCIACLSTDVKLYEVGDGEVRKLYNTISGLKTQKYENLPNYICYICLATLRRCKEFREKCQRTYFTLRNLAKSSIKVEENNLKFLDRSLLGIGSNLNYPTPKSVIRVISTQFQWPQHFKQSLTSHKVLVTHCNADTSNSYEVPVTNKIAKPEKDTKIFNSQTDLKVEENTNNDNTHYESDNDFSNYLDDTSGNLSEFLIPKEKNTYDNPMEVEIDGMNIEQEEYANIFALSIDEAKAVIEVEKMTRTGSYPCDLCSKSYQSESRLQHHHRMHDKHISGPFQCAICSFCYKTEFLLKTHAADKHMFKYECKKCNEVNYTKVSAKQHYIWTHLSKDRFSSKWKDNRPKWLQSRGGARIKGVSYKNKHVVKKPPESQGFQFNGKIKEIITYTPVSQQDQYQIVLDRQKSRNYLEALFKCELCFKGFRAEDTYEKHLRKHNSEISGNLQCDMCKIFVKSQRQMYTHVTTCHVYKYNCKVCSFNCHNRNQALLHFRWHNNVTYDCPHCDRKFRKLSTSMTHIRIKHPSTVICQICGHSFVSDTGLYCHKRIAHTKEEIESYENMEVSLDSPLYCRECDIQLVTLAAYNTHLETSSKHSQINNIHQNTSRSSKPRARSGRGAGRPGASDVVNNGVPTPTCCDVCDQVLPNDVQARKHYETEHPGHEYLKRYMCDVCGHTTKQYANLMAHMRIHTREKPYECPHCDRRFSLPSNRDRHIVVHTGEKRYQCQHCSRRFTQNNACKLHIQTVHMKIPYAPWNKAHRKRKAKQAAARLAESAKPQTFYENDPNDLTMLQPAQHKIVIDNTQGDYLNAYITYNED